jgi:hypothetical protein
MAEYKGEEFKFPDEKETEVQNENEKFEVEIEDDTPPADRNRAPLEEPVEEVTQDELESYDEKVQKRIKKFTRGYHDERRAKEEAMREREAAENYARQVIEENKRLQQQLSSGSKAYIETSKGAAEVELEAAKRAYKQAYDDGNADALVAAQEAITKATIKMDRASGMKPIEVEEREFKAPPPVEQDKPRLTPRTQRWVDNNSDWWGVDEEMTMAAMGIDKKLQREYGSDYVGTEEYFQTIDKTMRKRFPEHFEDAQSSEDDTPPPKKRVSEPVEEDYEPPRRAKPAAVVAPATRSTPPNRIRLKASEAAIARRLGVSIEEYARQVAKLKRGE